MTKEQAKYLVEDAEATNAIQAAKGTMALAAMPKSEDNVQGDYDEYIFVLCIKRKEVVSYEFPVVNYKCSVLSIDENLVKLSTYDFDYAKEVINFIAKTL